MKTNKKITTKKNDKYITLDKIMIKLKMKSRQAVRAYLNLIEDLTWEKWKNSYFFLYIKNTSVRRVINDKEKIKELIKLNKLRKNNKPAFYIEVVNYKNK